MRRTDPNDPEVTVERDEDEREPTLPELFDHVQGLLKARGARPFQVVGAMGIVLRRVDDKGTVEVIDAPEVSAITLELLAAADSRYIAIRGDVITLCGVVDYHVVGWDSHTNALLVELVDDRRTGR